MATVTERISKIKQPYGGYVPAKSFECISLDDSMKLSVDENIHASLVGMVVDYMSRFMSGKSVKEAFAISLKGADRAEKIGLKDAKAMAFVAVRHIKGLDDESIKNACKLVTYDVWLRNVSMAMNTATEWDVNPDKDTINNIRIMVERSVKFFDEYGPIVCEGFTFETDGYTDTVNSGDGDFLTCDTLWDFKVSKNNITSKHTLQLLMYWIMGIHSGKEEFKDIKCLGIFNPRLNKVYRICINEISKDVIKEVEENVIGYKKSMYE